MCKLTAIVDEYTVFTEGDIYRPLGLFCECNGTLSRLFDANLLSIPLWLKGTFRFKPVRFNDNVSILADPRASVGEKDFIRKRRAQLAEFFSHPVSDNA